MSFSNSPNLKPELRNELTLTLSSILKIHEQNRKRTIQNIHFINTPIMVNVVVKILDYSGGPIDSKFRQAGLSIYNSLKALYTEKALARFLLFAIKHSNNPSLTGFLISEFKSGIYGVIKTTPYEKINEAVSQFLNIQIIKLFVEMSLNQKSPKYIDDPELIAASVNILVFIFLKCLNMRKEMANYKDLKIPRY